MNSSCENLSSAGANLFPMSTTRLINEVYTTVLDIPDRLQELAREMQSNNFLLKLETRSPFPIIYSQASSLGRASAKIELTTAAHLFISS